MLKRFNQVIYSNKEPVNKNDIWIDDNNVIRIYKNGDWEAISGGEGGIGEIDTKMSNTSSNPVANKTIKKYVDLHPQYERIDEIEAPDINLGGGGGGTTTSGIQALEVRYNWDGTPLSDEDKAVNAATYTKLIADTNNIPYVTHNDEAMGITAKYRGTIMSLPTEDDPSCVFVIDIPLVNERVGMLLSYKKYSIELSSDGNVEGFMLPEGYVYLKLQAGMTFQQIMDNITANGLNPYIFAAFTDKVILNEYRNGNLIMSSNHITHYVVGENRIEFIAEHPIDGVRRFYRCLDSDANGLECFTISGGILYIDPDEVTIDYNKDIFADLEITPILLELNTFRIKKVNTYYTPISYDIHTTDSIMDYVRITIYCDGAFETWQINSDGTTQQIN